MKSSLSRIERNHIDMNEREMNDIWLNVTNDHRLNKFALIVSHDDKIFNDKQTECDLKTSSFQIQ